MVEQWTENPCVGSSILPSTTKNSPQDVLRALFLWCKHLLSPAASRLPPGARGKDSPTRLRRSPFGRPSASENAPITRSPHWSHLPVVPETGGVWGSGGLRSARIATLTENRPLAALQLSRRQQNRGNRPISLPPRQKIPSRTHSGCQRGTDLFSYVQEFT